MSLDTNSVDYYVTLVQARVRGFLTRNLYRSGLLSFDIHANSIEDTVMAVFPTYSAPRSSMLKILDMVAGEPLFRNKSRRAKSSTLSKEMELEMMWIEKAIRERIQLLARPV